MGKTGIPVPLKHPLTRPDPYSWTKLPAPTRTRGYAISSIRTVYFHIGDIFRLTPLMLIGWQEGYPACKVLPQQLPKLYFLGTGLTLRDFRKMSQLNKKRGCVCVDYPIPRAGNRKRFSSEKRCGPWSLVNGKSLHGSVVCGRIMGISFSPCTAFAKVFPLQVFSKAKYLSTIVLKYGFTYLSPKTIFPLWVSM